MKIQCNCGAKYSFDVGPEMVNNPVRFVCPSCGVDSSALVNELIRQQFGAAAAVPVAEPVVAYAAAAQPSVAYAVAQPAASAAVQCEPPPSDYPSCPKHPKDQAVEKCRMCGKPICLKCMELFGYLCSPLCKARATSQGIRIPVYQGQKSVVEARQWKKFVWIGGSAAAVIVLFLGVWFWYAWFGCAPRVVFSVRFPTPSYSGESVFADKERTQLVFLHGDELARYDLKTEKKLWSRQLLDRKAIAEEVERDLKARAAAHAEAALNGYSEPFRAPSPQELQEEMEKDAAAALKLMVRGENVWVLSPEKIRRFDWKTGRVGKEFASERGQVVTDGDNVFIAQLFSDTPKVQRLNLVTSELQEVELPPIRKPQPKVAAASGPAAKGKAGKASPLQPPKPLDPAKVIEEVQALPYQAQIALPAILSAKVNQDRIMAELYDLPAPAALPGQTEPRPLPRPKLIPTPEGLIAMSSQLLEEKLVTRVAMKPPPAKSALDGNVRASQSLEIANEILNEMQRERGGDKVVEDQSRYEVTIVAPGGKQSFKGEVTGTPRLIPLRTVYVLASSKSIVVLDKSLKKMWESAMSYDLPGGDFFDLGFEEENSSTGPCIERKDSLYVFDEGVLSAFDLRTGNARWRLPTVGIGAVFFDEEENLYVNTTTASHEKIKFSRQIDVTDIPGAIVMKVDSKTGKVLWQTDGAGWITEIKGDYIFAVSSYAVPEDVEALRGTSFETGFEKKAYLRIRRISPKDGDVVWEHYEARAPLHMEIEDNVIRLVFRKEVEILKFMKL